LMGLFKIQILLDMDRILFLVEYVYRNWLS